MIFDDEFLIHKVTNDHTAMRLTVRFGNFKAPFWIIAEPFRLQFGIFDHP